MSQSIRELLGEDLAVDPLGEDLAGGLIAGATADRSIVYIPQTTIGDGLAGPLNVQDLAIYRDARPLAVDELGMHGPFLFGGIARHRAGRMFPLNLTYGPAGLDPHLPGRVPLQDALELTPFSPGMLPDWHDGIAATEVLPSARTVYYTASPNVGWQGY